jgi:hypothetical protein
MSIYNKHFISNLHFQRLIAFPLLHLLKQEMSCFEGLLEAKRSSSSYYPLSYSQTHNAATLIVGSCPNEMLFTALLDFKEIDFD